MRYRIEWVLLLVAILCGRIAAAADATPGLIDWAEAVFKKTASKPEEKVAGPPAFQLSLQRQEHGQLQFGKSVMGTPLKIGETVYKHGLGTHANSEILVKLADGVKSFKAFVGVDSDNNAIGTVQFAVERDGKEIFRSATLRGGENAIPVDIDCSTGKGDLLLKTDSTTDGASGDHADWADPQFVMKNGSTIWVDEIANSGPSATSNVDFLLSDRPPFSFVYDSKTSESLLPQWTKTAESTDATDRVTHIIRWTDPKTGLKIVATVIAFKDFPAVDWVLRFENGGQQDTPILERIQALDTILGASTTQGVTLDQINGDYTNEQTFVPFERELKNGETVGLGSGDGRPSSSTFPFYNIQVGDHGLFTAIGWTGHWVSGISRAANGVKLTAGIEITHFILHPGESVRTPRIMLMRWSGVRIEAHNLFRRLLLAHYYPKLDGKPIQLAIGAQTFNSYPSVRPIWGTEAGQIEAAKVNKAIGADTLWMDAGWFEGNFPNGAGNWFPRAKDFPNGLKPVGETCHQLGLRFLVWYEPERVVANTQIAREHPDFVLGGAAGGLFNLANENALKWMQDLLNKQIQEFGIDCWRSDFNMDPLPFWRNNDAPNRQGITESHYVEGFYKLWDSLREKNPKIYLDDCASGGRRIDLETVMRSVVQTRSDTEGGQGRADWDQSQNYGLSLFLPLHASFEWDTKTYDIRSSATAGFLSEWDILSPAFPVAEIRTNFTEIKENQKYWYGDYYPLTAWTMAADQWMAWQLNRPDLDEGIALAFRHEKCPYPSLQVSLHGLKPDQNYEVTFIDEEHRITKKTMTGKELSTAELRIEKPRNSLIVRYKAVGK